MVLHDGVVAGELSGVAGDAVQLGGFFSVTLLIIVLMAARLGIRLLIDRAWPRDGSA